MYLFVFGMSIAMVMIAYVLPQGWRITGFYSTVPLGVMLASHALFPIMGQSDYPKLVPFTLKIRQARVRDGDQSGDCATTQGLILRNQAGCAVALLLFRLRTAGWGRVWGERF
jgi:hypothetical protein